MKKEIIKSNYEFTILDTRAKFESVLVEQKLTIMVSYSGGKDSDILLYFITLYVLPFIKQNNLNIEIVFVFFDTGLEYEATKRHIAKRKAEGHNIITERAYKPIPLAVKQHGQPFVSKYASDMLQRLQSHNFDFELHGRMYWKDLVELYPNCVGGIKWWCNFYGSKDDSEKNQRDYTEPSKSSFNIDRRKHLRNFILTYGLPFKVSAKCCWYAKKQTSHKYERENKPNIVISGVRKAEGGIRARAYKNCFNDTQDIIKYMPLFWWKDYHVKMFAEENNIIFSDCYEVFGLKRTGCAACPFAKDYQEERLLLKKYEPKLSVAVEHIFKDSFSHTEKFETFKKIEESKLINITS